MTAEGLERELLQDLQWLGDRFLDRKSAGELYRALARNQWGKTGFDGRVALSFKRAEELINELLERRGEEPLPLAQTGGEGDVDDTIMNALGELGWTVVSLDTTEHDPDHLASEEDPPPKGHGERMAPVGDSSEWEREAREEADSEVRKKLGREPR